MDPNVAWKELCEILNGEITSDSADRGAELCNALHEWVSAGGMLPAEMEHCGRNAFDMIVCAIEGSLEIWSL